MASTGLNNIVICGSGLAFEATLAALANNLAETVNIAAIELSPENHYDIFYGNVMPPTAYKDHLLFGLDEPRLIKETNSSFSYGTHYENWAGTLSWTQSHHLPLPVWNGLEMHFYLNHIDSDLDPFLVNSVCGRNGRFAHPPSDKNIALSKAEYGYQFRPEEIAALLAKQDHPKNVKRLQADITHIEMNHGQIRSIELSNGERLTAELFIDCSGPSAKLMKAMKGSFIPDRTLGAAEFIQNKTQIGGALRLLRGQSYGWQSITNLRNKLSRLAVYHPQDVQALEPHFTLDDAHNIEIQIGHRQYGWSGNCVGIGHVNYVIEPLTPAPMMLLYRDIRRLLDLIPISTNMQVEAKEFNRLLANDVSHCDIFTRAFYEVKTPLNTAYFQTARTRDIPEKLNRKLTQFESRGYLTAYDLEPFNKEDWTILHFGMKRRQTRPHPLLSDADMKTAQIQLNKIKEDIKLITQKVPPHDRYVTNFLRYLNKNNS